MKLSTYAKKLGLTYKTVWRLKTEKIIKELKDEKNSKI